MEWMRVFERQMAIVGRLGMQRGRRGKQKHIVELRSIRVDAVTLDGQTAEKLGKVGCF